MIGKPSDYSNMLNHDELCWFFFEISTYGKPFETRLIPLLSMFFHHFVGGQPPHSGWCTKSSTPSGLENSQPLGWSTVMICDLPPKKRVDLSRKWWILCRTWWILSSISSQKTRKTQVSRFFSLDLSWDLMGLNGTYLLVIKHSRKVPQLLRCVFFRSKPSFS